MILESFLCLIFTSTKSMICKEVRLRKNSLLSLFPYHLSFHNAHFLPFASIIIQSRVYRAATGLLGQLWCLCCSSFFAEEDCKSLSLFCVHCDTYTIYVL